ncbi:nicotinamide-nucleotide amidohydrolase family protein [Brevibacterium marinum]|uniref:Nicotinamide-nucleotide amidase n=1 Tax=Brevibacterium marinum TaxID=418643 RepID=A0A846S085_9MICO|nr:nicotinamide-nucleotide amidase [Brevibacterium marinum]
MTNHNEHENNAAEIAESLAELCGEHGVRVAVAESLTGGRISSQLAAASGSADWFAGGVVAYSSEVKHELLEVPPDAVISQASVESMARSVARMMDVDAAVAASGAGGPVGQDGQEPGTTWIAVLVGDEVRSELHRFQGDPIDILALTEERALTMLLESLSSRFRQS